MRSIHIDEIHSSNSDVHLATLDKSCWQQATVLDQSQNYSVHGAA
jgi:hypothetical protein